MYPSDSLCAHGVAVPIIRVADDWEVWGDGVTCVLQRLAFQRMKSGRHLVADRRGMKATHECPRSPLVRLIERIRHRARRALEQSPGHSKVFSDLRRFFRSFEEEVARVSTACVRHRRQTYLTVDTMEELEPNCRALVCCASRRRPSLLMTIPPRIAALETNGDTTTTNDDDIAFCSSSVRSRVEQRRKRKACSDRV